MTNDLKGGQCFRIPPEAVINRKNRISVLGTGVLVLEGVGRSAHSGAKPGVFSQQQAVEKTGVLRAHTTLSLPLIE